MSTTKPHNRVFAFVLALMFVVPVVASGAAVVYQIAQDRKATKATEGLKQQAKLANASTRLSCSTNNIQEPNMVKEGKLEGTQLQNFVPVATVNTLSCIDLKEGNGDIVAPGATVTAHYTGAVAATGVIFQSSHDSGQPIPFSLNGVIKGWTDGVPGMKVGGWRRLLIPADQAYGANPPSGSGIPANAPLVFDIELTDVQQ